MESNKTIIAADTVVILDNQIIGKPAGKEEAVSTLSRLQGNTHQVVTGVAILKGEKQVLFADVTEVAFNPLHRNNYSFMWRNTSLMTRPALMPYRSG